MRQGTGAGRDLPAVDPEAHQSVTEFARWAARTTAAAQAKRYEAWLAQPNAVIDALLTSGWAGAALIIGNGGQLALGPDPPEWFDFGYAKALQLRDGKEAARKWLEALATRTPTAEWLLGELQLTSGGVDQGLATLGKIAAGGTPLAGRAVWTLALAELDRGNFTQARALVLANAAFAATVQGRELLARAALAEGTRAEAVRIYQELGDTSADAMIFLAKEAFAAKDFAQARKWAATLARRFPEQPEFRQNLLKIDEAEKAAKP